MRKFIARYWVTAVGIGTMAWLISSFVDTDAEPSSPAFVGFIERGSEPAYAFKADGDTGFSRPSCKSSLGYAQEKSMVYIPDGDDSRVCVCIKIRHGKLEWRRLDDMSQECSIDSDNLKRYFK
jgi:hypothetical protein